MQRLGRLPGIHSISSTNRTLLLQLLHVKSTPAAILNQCPPMIRVLRPHCGTETFPAFINYLVCNHELDSFAMIDCSATVSRRNFFTCFGLTLDNP